MAPPFAQLRGVSKRFPGVIALDDVSLDVVGGEVHGLAGENGSGKSTLVRMLAGRERPDEGEIVVDGRSVDFRSPADALTCGIALVAQEVLVNPHLSVAENVLAGRLPRRRGRIHWAEAHRLAAAQLERFHAPFGTRQLSGSLALRHQHLVSIVQMVAREPRLLVLDEPTSSLSSEESAVLLDVLDGLRREGRAVLFISHRLSEYRRICDRITVLRDGALVATQPAESLDEGALVRLMVGRDLGSVFARRPRASRRFEGPPVLEARALTSERLRGVSLSVAAGEVLGVAGQAGSGRSTLARTLFGASPHTGTICVEGRTVRLRSPRDAMAAGIAFVPEDRKRSGLILGMTVGDNVCLPVLNSLAGRAGVRRPDVERGVVVDAMRRLSIKAVGADTPIRTLSGGNQQKVVLAKWLARHPRVLVLDEPTRGVDVGAKAEIYDLIEQLADGGLAVVLVSSELPELLRLSDRIVVMVKGRTVGELAGEDASEEAVVALAFQGQTEAAA